MENSAIVADFVFANLGFVTQRSDRVDFPFHKVRIRVFDVFTKQQREAPIVLSVVQRIMEVTAHGNAINIAKEV
jgi:hypothetical protein